MKKKEDKIVIKAQAYSQILILIVATFAFAFLMGGGLVSAVEPNDYQYIDSEGDYWKVEDGKTFIYDSQEDWTIYKTFRIINGKLEIKEGDNWEPSIGLTLEHKEEWTYLKDPTSTTTLQKGQIINIDGNSYNVLEDFTMTYQNDIDAGSYVEEFIQKKFLSRVQKPTEQDTSPTSIPVAAKANPAEPLNKLLNQNKNVAYWKNQNKPVARKFKDATLIKADIDRLKSDLDTGYEYNKDGNPIALTDEKIQSKKAELTEKEGLLQTIMGDDDYETLRTSNDMGNAKIAAAKTIYTSYPNYDELSKEEQDQIFELETELAKTGKLSPENKEILKGLQKKGGVASKVGENDWGFGYEGYGEEEYDILGITKWKTKQYFLGNLAEGLQWGLAVLGIVETLGSIGLLDEETAESAGPALFASILAGKGVYGLTQQLGGTPKTATTAGWVAAIVVFLFTYEDVDYRVKQVNFQCMPWQAPNGGDNCEKCNEDRTRPCSEYRCKSLGVTCGIINEGTDKVQCIDKSPYDTESPGIRPLDSALTNGYDYTQVTERPPGGEGQAGMTISKNGGCIDPFTPITFGIETFNDEKLEPAQCKFDINHTASFDEMAYFVGDNNLFIINHTQNLYSPAPDTTNRLYPTIENDGREDWYIRCKDGNGNVNEDEFVVSFCVDDGPDLTVPQIKDTNIRNGQPVRYQVDNVSIDVYVSEPVEGCRWSRIDEDYNNMDNDMLCSNNVWEINAEMLYTCTTTLTAIEDRAENNFYFRCKDLNNNTMRQSYEFKLVGTQPLDILKVGPNSTVGGSTETVVVTLEVETDNGFRNGESICYYSENGVSGWQEMFDTGGNKHKQDLDLGDGDYTYYLRCVDEGGNDANSTTSFDVFVDKYAPLVIRTYYEGNKLKVRTNEEAECRYSTQGCNYDFDEGTLMPFSQDKKEHYAPWERNAIYYLKCVDKYNNQPNPSDCSIILIPYERLINN